MLLFGIFVFGIKRFFRNYCILDLDDEVKHVMRGHFLLDKEKNLGLRTVSLPLKGRMRK